ncbi:MAG: c-type cytochrome domain-containing protein [Vicinamibacteraceae bacterium]
MRRIAIILGFVVLGVAVTVAVRGIDTANPPQAVLLLGRLHPAAVHFPIGALVLAALLEVAACVGPFRDLRLAVPFALLVGVVTASVAALAGYCLSLDGGYEPTLVSRHMWLGVAVLFLASVGLVLALVVRRRDSPPIRYAHRAVLFATTGLVLVTGHYGGTLTHGPGYLTRYLPAFLGGGDGTAGGAGHRLIEDIDSALVFRDLVLPVLERRCVKCHGSSTSKGNLRLDAQAGLEKGGRDGPALVAGNPGQSDMIRRIVLPPFARDAMPPDGEAPLDVGEIELIRWWVAGGASFAARVREMPDAPTSVDTYLGRLAAPRAPRKTGIFAVAVPEPGSAAVAAVERAGFSVRRLALDAPFLEVTALPIRDSLTNDVLARLAPIRNQIASLDLSLSRVDRLEAVAHMPHLVALHLQRTGVTDEDLAHLSGLRYLESLNVHGTDVSDAGLERLAGLKSLRRLYVWQTKVSDEGAKKLRAGLPELEVNMGSGFSEDPPKESS